MVAASRMGNMMNPKWCFSEVPFDMAMAENRLNASDSISKFVITMRIKTGETVIERYTNNMDNLACESL
jgi:predicted patatin/cPLA2 family phospholipase